MNYNKSIDSQNVLNKAMSLGTFLMEHIACFTTTPRGEYHTSSYPFHFTDRETDSVHSIVFLKKQDILNLEARFTSWLWVRDCGHVIPNLLNCGEDSCDHVCKFPNAHLVLGNEYLLLERTIDFNC